MFQLLACYLTEQFSLLSDGTILYVDYYVGESQLDVVRHSKERGL